MIIKVHKSDAGFTQVPNTTARDYRLDLDTRGLLTMILSFPANFRLSVHMLLDEVNKGRDDNDQIGEKSLRRMTTQLKDTGYLKIKSLYDETSGKFQGKEWHVYATSDSAPTVVKAAATNPELVESTEEISDELQLAKFPAAFIFQNIFNVTLDADTIEHIANEVSPEQLTMWQKVCKDHWAGMTPQQKTSEPFRQKAVQFMLKDLRREVEKAEQSAMRNQYAKSKDIAERTDIMDPNLKQPPKTFASYAGKYEYGSIEYIAFKESWLMRALEIGNTERAEEVEQYEGLHKSLDRSKARKGSVAK